MRQLTSAQRLDAHSETIVLSPHNTIGYRERLTCPKPDKFGGMPTPTLSPSAFMPIDVNVMKLETTSPIGWKLRLVNLRSGQIAARATWPGQKLAFSLGQPRRVSGGLS